MLVCLCPSIACSVLMTLSLPQGGDLGIQPGHRQEHSTLQPTERARGVVPKDRG